MLFFRFLFNGRPECRINFYIFNIAVFFLRNCESCGAFLLFAGSRNSLRLRLFSKNLLTKPRHADKITMSVSVQNSVCGGENDALS